MDIISNLPDEIIRHVGSFLSAKEAAFAMVLSKRWRNLFTIVPELHFHRSGGSLDNGAGDFKDFVDEVLAIPVTTRLRKLSLKWGFEENDPAQYDYVNRCLRHVLKLGVLILKLEIDLREGLYSLPSEVFTCETVAKLKLGLGFAIDFLPKDAYLPALKSLFLDSVRFYEFGRRCAFQTLISACPALEELVIDSFNCELWKWLGTVSSPTVQRLRIRRELEDWEYYQNYGCDVITFDTPALVYLDYSNPVPKSYQIVNLNSLVEAKLHLCLNENGPLEQEYLMTLINGVKDVEIMDLSLKTMEVLYCFPEEVPMFENLSHLSFKSKAELCWFGLPVLLQNSPKLKTLTIEGSLHIDHQDILFEPFCACLLGYSFLLTCRIEVLKITKFKGDHGEMLHLEHVLLNLPYLELLEIHIEADVYDEEMKIYLLTITRASPKCKIQIVS